ncbi:MAG: pyridoxamine 5'-phosphate oxidase family protein [Candidatus Hodarchaeota archaeon]
MSKDLKKMPETELKQDIRKFFSERKVLVLCTASKDGIPRASSMDFYMEKGEDNFNIYVGLSPGIKIKNIEQNPIVSIGIYTPLDTGKIQGMQITATGKERLILMREGDQGFDEAQKIVRGKRNLLLKIIPEKIELLDYSYRKKGYLTMQVLEL